MLSKRKIIFASLSLLFLGWLVSVSGFESIGVATAHAQATEADESFKTMVNLMAAAIAILEFLTFLIFKIAAPLLDPAFIVGMLDNGTSMNTTLNNMWQTSRNLMNIIFAFLLIGGAIITVVTAKKDIIGTYATKFVIAVILVNFSWFFPRVIIDVAHVLTATVYQLPSTMSPSVVCETRAPDGTIVPCEVVTDILVFKDCHDLVNSPSAAASGYIPLVGNNLCVKRGTLSPNTNTAYGVINGLVINHARLGQLARVTKPDLTDPAANPRRFNKVSEFIFFIIHVSLVLVLHVMLFFPIAAMAAILLVRIPIIWLTIAFMPFMFLGYVIGDKMKSFDTMQFIWKKFLAAAFIPLAMAIPFTVGFMMINSSMFSAAPVGFDYLQNNLSPFLSGVNNLWEFIWMIITFMVIWVGFFSATKIDPVFEKVGGWFEQTGKNIGKFALKAPAAVPVLPFGGKDGEKASALQVGKVLQNPDQMLISGGKLRGINEALGGGSKDGAGGISPTAASKIDQDVKNTTYVNFDVQQKFNKFINNPNQANFDEIQRLAPNSDLRNPANINYFVQKLKEKKVFDGAVTPREDQLEKALRDLGN